MSDENENPAEKSQGSPNSPDDGASFNPAAWSTAHGTISDTGTKGDPTSRPLPPSVDISADLNVKDVNKVLEFFKGNIALSAKWFGRSRTQFMRFIESHVECVALLQELRDALIDNAEMNYAIAVERGDLQASSFVLETLGKDRGFTKKKEIENTYKDAPPTQIVFTVAAPQPASALPPPSEAIEGEFAPVVEEDGKVVDLEKRRG